MNVEETANWQSWAAPVVVVAAFLWLLLRRRFKRSRSKGCNDCGTGKSC